MGTPPSYYTTRTSLLLTRSTYIYTENSSDGSMTFWHYHLIWKNIITQIHMSVATCNRNESLLISILKTFSMSVQGTYFVPKSTLWQRYYRGADSTSAWRLYYRRAESTSAWRLYYRGADSTSAWRLLTGLRGRRCRGDVFE